MNLIFVELRKSKSSLQDVWGILGNDEDEEGKERKDQVGVVWLGCRRGSAAGAVPAVPAVPDNVIANTVDYY